MTVAAIASAIGFSTASTSPVPTCNAGAPLCVEGLGNLAVAELTPRQQQQFVERLRTEVFRSPTSSARWGAQGGPGPVLQARRAAAVPYIITGDLKDSRPRERVLELAELVALRRAIDSGRWRGSALLLGTGARPGVLST